MTAAPSQPPRRRKKSARFVEIAAEAGVSVATVDRVLNERDSVSERTRATVLAAARRLRLPRFLPEAGHGLVHIDVLLPRSETPFIQRLALAFRDAAALLDRRVIVHRRQLTEGDVAAMAAAIRAPQYARAGVILAAPDVAPIQEALRVALARGESAAAVVTSLGDVPGLAYCGMDNHRAGMVAGHLAGRIARGPGRVLVMGNMLYRAHQDRFDGFARAVAAFPGLTVDLIEDETRDDAERCHRAIARSWTGALPVVAIYNTGAGSDGIRRALAPLGAARPAWVGHEALDDHVADLAAGLLDFAIDQDAVGQAMAALQHVLRGAGLIEAATGPARSEMRVHSRFSIL